MKTSSVFLKIFSGLKEFELNPFTLSFSGKNAHLEPEFKEFYLSEKIEQIRVAHIIGIIFYILFGFLDYFLLDDLIPVFWSIRFATVFFLIMAVVALTYIPVFYKWSQFAVLFSNLFAGFGIIGMIAVSHPPVSYLYYAGLTLIFIFLAAFSAARFIYVVISTVLLIAGYEIVSIFDNEMVISIFVSNNFFFVTAAVLSLFASYFIEYSLRRTFYLTTLLEKQKEEVEFSKNHLEHLVNERTVQLSESNKELSSELEDKKELLIKQQELPEQLVQSQKMEAVGQLAGGVAHDFNNMLTIINGYSELLLVNMDETNANFEKLGQIQKAGKRAETLTRQLLAFSRKQILQPTIVNLNHLLDDLKKMLQHLIGENIKLELNFQPDLYKIKADPGQLEQVIMNLVVNARDAMPNGGTIILSTSNIDAQNDEDKKVRLCVSDTGSGIDEGILEHIFEPFFTTKEKGKGTGLGLSTVYGIIKQSNASIEVDSKPENGTTFKITFDVVRLNQIKTKTHLNGKIDSHGDETILVVEDENAVREYVGVVLQKYGYNVLLTSSGKEALSTFKDSRRNIDLVITDVIMPEMSGKELILNLLSDKPDLKYIYISGYTDDVIGQQGILEEEISIIQKPFSNKKLLEKIRSVLDYDVVKPTSV